MEKLPPEVLELVFAHVPMLELLSIESTVCKRWRDIISRPLFLPWKKSYFRLKMDAYEEDDQPSPSPESSPPPSKRTKNVNDLDMKLAHFKTSVGPFSNQSINKQNHLHPPVEDGSASLFEKFRLETAGPWLIQFVATEFAKEAKEGQFELLSRHKKFSWAQDWLNERMPEMKEKEDIAALVVICCIASDAWDVYEIFQVLSRPSMKSCRSHIITEVMYCIALGFLYFSRHHDLPLKWHYNVFHAISFFENEFNHVSDKRSLDKPNGQTSLTRFGFGAKLRLTAEQARVASHRLVKNGQDLVKIVAFAGTGKTTTLIRMAQEHPELKFLVVVYNTSVKDHAIEAFPRANVRVKTCHGLAHEKVGFMYRNKYLLCDNIKAKDILDSKLMTEGVDGAGNPLRRAAQIVATLESFMNSPDEEITLEHVPSRWRTKKGEENLTPLQRNILEDDSKTIWSAMININNKSIKLPHDGYLKLFQLKKPSLQKNFVHDVLMIDEGQDMNPAMLDIFIRQKTNKIIVGDPNQQIYNFRGAINAIGSIEATHTYHLTQSFRFGPNIGMIANNCLEKLQKVTSQTLVGGKKVDRIINRREILKNIKDFRPIAIIGRTNLELFREIVRIACDSKNPPRCALAGTYASYNFDHLLDIFHLYNGEPQRMERFKTFKSFARLEVFAESTNDASFVGKIKIVKEFKERIPSILEKINRNCCYSPKTADYVFSTTHKAKGLEWKTVVLLDDFFDVPGAAFSKSGQHEQSHEVDPMDDEKNLLYVAMTRAKENLVMNVSLLNLFLKSGDTLENVVHMTEKKACDPNILCIACKDQLAIEDNCLGLQSTAVSVENVWKKSGVLCSVCASAARLKNVNLHSKGFKQGWKWMRMENRQFLRYFVGALPDRYKDALNKVKQSEPVHNFMNAHVLYQQNVFEHMFGFDDALQIMFPEVNGEDDYYDYESSDQSDEENVPSEIDQEVLDALDEDF